MEKKLQVEAIAFGTVIDHIPAGQGVKILKFFELADGQQRITIGLNLPSGKGCKDLIKVTDTQFTQEQANQLALFAPDATVNLIEHYKVVTKFTVAIPKQVVDVLTCPNSNCICHNEPVASRFYVRTTDTTVKLKCHYCEKSFESRFFNELD